MEKYLVYRCREGVIRLVDCSPEEPAALANDMKRLINLMKGTDLPIPNSPVFGLYVNRK